MALDPIHPQKTLVRKLRDNVLNLQQKTPQQKVDLQCNRYAFGAGLIPVCGKNFTMFELFIIDDNVS